MVNAKAQLSVLVFAAALAASAATSISNVVVNQRWPWSEKVDVDFILSGDASEVHVSARWDAHPEPYALGMLNDCAPGHHRLTWDPAASPFAGQTLTGFTVTVTNEIVVRDYAVIDLVNGGCTYRGAPPDGGWTDEYKSTKMAFRRIPAGTYTLGEPKSTFSYLEHWDVDGAAKIMNRRTVVFTNDFYVGIFKYTEAQHACLMGTGGSSGFKPIHVSYDDLRGAQPDVDWPNTGYKVAEGSLVAKLRAKAGDGIVVDLCEEEQWEAAARAGKATFWPNGGTVGESMEVLNGYLDAIAIWSHGTVVLEQSPVGLKNDNGWGLYDIVGLDGEWVLDKAAGMYSPTYGLSDFSVNPTGISEGSNRILRSANGNGKPIAIYDLLPCRRQIMPPGNADYSTRFCIHLSPLDKLTFDGL